ncbi:hypothetical protein L208DRAFT_1471534, partial [Tricholoma matsutake]
MARPGWTECDPKGLTNKSASYETIPGNCSAAEWKKVVTSKRQQILEDRLENYQWKSTGETSQSILHINKIFEGIKVVDKDYLVKKCINLDWKIAMDSVVKDFHLNTDQGCAFRIIANHSCSSSFEQLKMHIGGMGGTGKSQVLKALIDFFKHKKESHQFVVVAPTGSAAALLSGSTYHYMFGINDFETGCRAVHLQLAEVKQILQGVDYIFMDEVSMLSCKDLYRINKRLAKVMNNTDQPFG